MPPKYCQRTVTFSYLFVFDSTSIIHDWTEIAQLFCDYSRNFPMNANPVTVWASICCLGANERTEAGEIGFVNTCVIGRKEKSGDKIVKKY